MTLLPSASLDAILSSLAGVLSSGPAIARLYVGPGRITGQTTLADMVEASFPGYAPVSVTTWSVNRVSPFVRLAGPVVSFQWSGLGVAESIMGAYMTLGSSLLWVEPFLAPIHASDASAFIEWAPALQMRSIAY